MSLVPGCKLGFFFLEGDYNLTKHTVYGAAAWRPGFHPAAVRKAWKPGEPRPLCFRGSEHRLPACYTVMGFLCFPLSSGEVRTAEALCPEVFKTTDATSARRVSLRGTMGLTLGHLPPPGPLLSQACPDGGDEVFN